MAVIKRRIGAVKGLTSELGLRVHKNDVVTNLTDIDGSTNFDLRYLGANETKVKFDSKLNRTDIVDEVNNDAVDRPASARAVKEVNQKVDALSGGIVYKGLFDASNGTLPSDVTKGWLYKVSAAGTIGGLELAIGDAIYANNTVVGSTTSSDWDKTDNTEAPDILRDGDISAEADWSLETDKLSTRETISNYLAEEMAKITIKAIEYTISIKY